MKRTNRFKNNVTKKKAKTNFYFRKFDPSHNCIKKELENN